MSGIFERVVCGVDDSEAGHLAARLAARLTEPDGSLTLVAVEDTSIAVHAGWQMAAVSHQLAGEASAALAHGAKWGRPSTRSRRACFEATRSMGCWLRSTAGRRA